MQRSHQRYVVVEEKVLIVWAVTSPLPQEWVRLFQLQLTDVNSNWVGHKGNSLALRTEKFRGVMTGWMQRLSQWPRKAISLHLLTLISLCWFYSNILGSYPASLASIQKGSDFPGSLSRGSESSLSLGLAHLSLHAPPSRSWSRQHRSHMDQETPQRKQTLMLKG